MDMEKMIVVKKSTKWWMTAVASASLAVGAIGGYGIGSLTQKSPQQSSVQATMPQQNKQDGKMPGQGGQAPQGQGQGNEKGMPPQMGGQKVKMVKAVPEVEVSHHKEMVNQGDHKKEINQKRSHQTPTAQQKMIRTVK